MKHGVARWILVLLVFTLLAGCGRGQPLEVGFVGPLSGAASDLGFAGRNGALLAIEQFNSAGGPDGRQVALVIRDDRQDQSTGRAMVQALIERQVSAIIGPMTSNVATAVTPLVNTAKMVMISPTASSDRLAGQDDFFFRVLSSAGRSAAFNARYQYRQRKLRQITIILDRGNRAYTEAWADGFERTFTGLGGELVQRIEFDSVARPRFSEIARRALREQTDGIVIISNALDASRLIQQVRKIAPEIPLSISEWAATGKFTELGGVAVEGVVVAQLFDRFLTDSEFVQFKQTFEARFKRPLGFAAITGYDAMKAILPAITGGVSGAPLKKWLLQQHAYSSSIGEFRFDRFGDADREVFMMVVRDGNFMRGDL